MSGIIGWIAGEAERPVDLPQGTQGNTEDLSEELPEPRVPVGTEGSAAEPHLAEDAGQADSWEFERVQRIYRGRTVAMLRRYMRYSIETGRLPSLLGREFFRAKVTSYTVVTFEDRVIFVHDMEKCLDKLDEFSRQLIARHILQEHEQAATAKLLNCTERTVRTYLPITLDLLSEILLDVGLLEPQDTKGRNSCQGGKRDEIFVSDCEQGKNNF